MKKTVFAIVFVFIHLQLLAQEQQNISNQNFKNKRAVLFSFDGFKLGEVNGGIGYKKWTSNNMIFFTSVNVNYYKDEKEKNDTGNGVENTKHTYGLSLGVLRQLNLKKRLSTYLGGIVGAGYERTENKVEPLENLRDFYNRSYQNESRRSLVTVSLQLILGMEYFIRDNISIEGQYKFGGNYGSGKEKTVSTVLEAEQDISRTNLGIWSSTIILSIYL